MNTYDSAPAEAVARRPLRVLQVGKFYPPHPGGIETHLQVLCERLHEEVDVRVLVANEGHREVVERVNGVEVKRAATPFTLAGAPVCPGMAREIRESGADIVHLHLPNPGAVLAYLASGHTGRLVVTYHSDIVRQRLLEVGFRPFLHQLLRRTDAIIASTPNYVESSAILSRYRSLCRTIPFGIPTGIFQQGGQEADAIRERFGPRTVLSVGRLVYYKGFQHLVQAMTRVRGTLLIVGDGPLRGELSAMIRGLGLEDRVFLLGKVEDTVPYYHASDVFVLASVARSEAFGIVQLEAMACAKPVVNTRLDSGVPFVSRHGETGLTVPPGDSAALADAINRLLDDEELRTRYGREARQRVEEEFSQETMAQRILQLYREVLGHTPEVDALAPGTPSAGAPQGGLGPQVVVS